MPTAIADGQAQQELDKAQADVETEASQTFHEPQQQLVDSNQSHTIADSGVNNKIICDNREETKGRKSRQVATAIDSRSILNNKQQLKRFWERRMEMDSLRSSSRGQETNGNKMTLKNRALVSRERQQSDAGEKSMKLASSKLMEFSPARDCESPPGEQDENNNCEHVSAELLCEKLLAYEQTQASRSAPKAKRKANDKPEVPNQDHTADAGQPMSINPTLCHVNTTSDDDELLDEQQDEEQVANEEFGSSNSSIVGPTCSGSTTTTSGPTTTAQAPKRSRSASLDSGDSQEETSTQSGSVLTVISNCVKPAEIGDSRSCANIESTREDQAGGGRATPTLITSIEDEDGPPPLVDGDGGGQSTVSAAESDASNIGVAFESLHFDDEIKSSRSEQVDEERLLAGGGGKRPLTTNLPVPAPGQVRPTIKLAADDNNDDDEQPAARRGDKFSSREVRSVCALITSAISDAGRQVEGYLRSQSNAKVAVAKTADAAAHDADDKSPITPTNQRQRGNHDDGGESTDQEEQEQESGFQRATFVREDSLSPQQPPAPSRQLTGLNGQRAEQVATIGYLADEDDDDEDHDEPEHGREHCPSPRADLSSIFEANVRREIERFESNTALRRQQNQPGGCGKKSAGLTEWRIAEEIRQFNEREKELKQRCSSSNASEMVQQSAAVAPPGGLNTKRQQEQQHQLESIVRFGKTLQIPKPSIEMHQPATTSKSIKLTTKGAAGTSQPATTISMHKFISSGGKRFVYQTVQVNSPSPSSQALDSNHLTKSMSNLSTCVQSINSTSGPTTRQVDYRAVDSLTCKEVPNVAPGLAKKTIETFARLNSETSLNKLGVDPTSVGGGGIGSGSMASNLNNGHSPTRTAKGASSAMSGNLNNGHTLRPQQPMTHGGASLPTAEWKIQEELREMRAREAELRSLRNQQRQQPVVAPTKPKHQQRNLIAANVKSLHQQRGAATEPALNNGGGVGKQRLLTRPNRFRPSHTSNANCDNDDDDDNSVEDIHLAHSAPRANNNDHDHDHDGLESAASGDDESNSEHDSERIRPVNAHGDDNMHPYQRQAATLAQQHNRANSTVVNGSGGDLAGSPDSLYPIKQTIDSFRKLNQQSASESSGDCNYRNNNNNSGGGGGSGQVSVTANSSASGELATYRSGQANKKASRQPQGLQRKQFVNSSSGGSPQTRPT